MFADLLAERLPLVGVADARVQAGLGQADRAGGNGETALVDGAHRDEEPLAFLPDPVLDRNGHIVKVDQAGVPGPDAELPVEGPGGQAGHSAFEQEGGHALVPPARSTEAKTRKWSARSASEIQIFWPLSR